MNNESHLIVFDKLWNPNEDLIFKDYFDWLCNRVKVNIKLYGVIMKILYDMDFYSVLLLDENRRLDGLKLRSYYTDNQFFINLLNDKPCSVLEVLIALSIRCDEDIMYDPDFGDRANKWFWLMIENLNIDILNGFIDDAVFNSIIEKIYIYF